VGGDEFAAPRGYYPFSGLLSVRQGRWVATTAPASRAAFAKSRTRIMPMPAFLCSPTCRAFRPVDPNGVMEADAGGFPASKTGLAFGPDHSLPEVRQSAAVSSRK